MFTKQDQRPQFPPIDIKIEENVLNKLHHGLYKIEEKNSPSALIVLPTKEKLSSISSPSEQKLKELQIKIDILWEEIKHGRAENNAFDTLAQLQEDYKQSLHLLL